MRFFPSIIGLSLIVVVFAAQDGNAETWPPTLTIYDELGMPYTAPDNSTVFEIIPGARCTFEVEGNKDLAYHLLYSLNTTGAMNGLFIQTPFLFLQGGSGPHYLDSQGLDSISVMVPRGFVSSSLTLYFQSVVDPGVGQELTNGITFEVIVPSVNAELAVHVGPYPGLSQGLDYITTIGTLDDDLAEDNIEAGYGLSNGEAITGYPDFSGLILSYLNLSQPTDRYPNPANSIFLNGYSNIVPGDAGLHPDFEYPVTGKEYPQTGSQMKIHRRDEICRNYENSAIQYIQIPPLSGSGGKDLNLYHIKVNNAPNSPTYGFAVLDVDTNEMEILSGTVIPYDSTMDIANVSSWDCNIAISPDRKYIAAARMDRIKGAGDNDPDQLYIIRLDNQPWDPGTNDTATQLIGFEATSFSGYIPNFIFPETMTFLESDDLDRPVLFLATNKIPANSIDPRRESGSTLWRYAIELDPLTADYKAKFYDQKFKLPATGTGQTPKYLGESNQYSTSSYPNNPTSSTLNWIKSKDNKTLCFPASGRAADTDPWDWDVYSITNVKATGGETIKNLTSFTAPIEVVPFGRCYNGTGKAAISEDGSVLAFLTRDSDGNEELYMYKTNGDDTGKFGLIEAGTDFDLNLLALSRLSVVDPYLLSNTELMFFCGEKKNNGDLVHDLFLYDEDSNSFTSLTQTGSPTSPFTDVGDVMPTGFFVTDDKHFYFFPRGKDETSGNDTINLVGIDLQNDFAMFSLTGSEFNNGVEIVPDVSVESDWNVEDMGFIYGPSSINETVLFSAKFQTGLTPSYQIFMLNLSIPFAALPITAFNPDNEMGIIDNLVISEDGLTIALSRSNTIFGTPAASEKIFVIDLNSFSYTRDLTESFNYTISAVDGSLRFIPGNSQLPNPTAPQLVFAYGLGSSGANNPFPSRAYVYPINLISNASLPTVTYPLTEAGSIYIYNAKP